MDIAARDRIDVTLEGRSDNTDQRLTLAASDMNIRWTYRGGSAFPRIRNADPVKYEAVIYTQPEIDFDKAPSDEEDMVDDSIVNPDRLVNPDLPQGIPDIEPAVENQEIIPGKTHLTMVVRRENDPWGTCVRVQLIDADGTLPTRKEACVDNASPVRSLVVRDAADYEEIRIDGDMTMRLPINGASGFNVEGIEIRL